MDEVNTTQIITRGISQIFEDDKRRLDNALSGRGWRYLAGAICIFPLTLIKVVDYLFRNKHLYHEPKITPMEEMDGIGLSSARIKQYARYIHFEQLEGYQGVFLNVDVIKEREEYNPRTSLELKKASAAQTLRESFTKNEKLEGTLLRVTHHRVNDADLLESAESGVLKGKYLTQRVTFGNENNALLKALFPLLNLRKLKNSTDTYFVFENDEVFELQTKLRDTFLRPVTIILRRGKNEE